VALASPIVAAADESEIIEGAPPSESIDQTVVIAPTTEPLVIELVVEGNPPTDTTESPGGVESDAPPADDTALVATELPDQAQPDSSEADATSTATIPEPVGAEPSPMIAAPETDSGEAHTGGTGDDHTGGTGDDHTGGTGGEHSGGSGTGNPYRMTFEVSWQLPDDSTIPVLDRPTNWRTLFDLAAASATGGGKPTSAHCTYPPGSSVLVCEFQNPGEHESVTDGMIVPAKPTATYSVTVLWPTSGWTIEGANAGPYSARDLCPSGGQGDGGGHDSGHGEALEAEVVEGDGTVCVHTVVMRRGEVTPEPPPVEPPDNEVPEAVPPQSPTPAPPVAAPTTPAVENLPVAVTPRALPATGNTATTTLMIGTIVLALGGCLSVLARRRNDLPLS
jgi:LPXTG-motif cell wall-anchored protein